MKLFTADGWLKAPLDRDVIARWTVGGGEKMSHTLEFPPPPDPERFIFLALGDTGDSTASGTRISPQDAIGHEMALDSALPESSGNARFILHTGDVIYMTGERRLYDRNFRRPYEPFLLPESTVDDLKFRLPFLPVPGNHDYYDPGGWAKWLARIPILGAGMRAISHQLFSFNLPEGGSGMGKAYMQAFVNLNADTRSAPLVYLPNEQTRLPNRYYKFRVGMTDFFALDSNTLDGPPPWTNTDQVRVEAANHIELLEARAAALDSQLRHEQLALDRWQIAYRDQLAQDQGRLIEILAVTEQVSEALARLRQALHQDDSTPISCIEAMEDVVTAERRWKEAAEDLTTAPEPSHILQALNELDEAGDESCTALRSVEGCLAVLPESQVRTLILDANQAIQQALEQWEEVVPLSPPELSESLRKLSEEALDVQRELALERRHLHYRPEDFDSAQMQWLDHSLAESIREHPKGWRIVYLHHPLYTTISNHCEHPDVQGLRQNLMGLLKGRVHLILSGHSHTFEWIHSDALPLTGIFVTGGGGQISLRPSLLEPQRIHRYRDRYESLRESGVSECAVAGRGPDAADGEEGLLYHYLSIEVTPDMVRVTPIGIRRLDRSYRREQPMPVFHAAELPEGKPPWNIRRLEAVEIRRRQPPIPVWK